MDSDGDNNTLEENAGEVPIFDADNGEAEAAEGQQSANAQDVNEEMLDETEQDEF